MARLPATDPANRIGTLFLNPGGPGASGSTSSSFVARDRDVRGSASIVPEIRARFDIVGFDPRGIMRSKPLQCFRDEKRVAVRRRSPCHTGGGGGDRGRRSRSGRCLRGARRSDPGPHVHRERRPRSRRSAPGGGRRRPQLHRLLVWLVPRRDVRQPVPRQRPRRRGRRRARPDRLDHGRSRPGEPSVLHPAAQRRRSPGDTGRVLPAVRRRRSELRLRSRLRGPLRRPGRPLAGRADRGRRPRHR